MVDPARLADQNQLAAAEEQVEIRLRGVSGSLAAVRGLHSMAGAVSQEAAKPVGDQGRC